MSALDDQPLEDENAPLTQNKGEVGQKATFDASDSANSQLLKKCRSDYLRSIDRETLADEKGLFV